VKRSLTPEEEKGWALHNRGMELYYDRSFDEAAAMFEETLRVLPGDFNAEMLLRRCRDYRRNPPPPDWDGVEVMETK